MKIHKGAVLTLQLTVIIILKLPNRSANRHIVASRQFPISAIVYAPERYTRAIVFLCALETLPQFFGFLLLLYWPTNKSSPSRSWWLIRFVGMLDLTLFVFVVFELGMFEYTFGLAFNMPYRGGVSPFSTFPGGGFLLPWWIFGLIDNLIDSALLKERIELEDLNYSDLPGLKYL